MAVLVLANNQAVLAANPTTMNFQGKVVNADGTNVANNTYSFIFRIYNTSSPTTTTSCTSTASCLWEETQASVTVTNGVFQVELGSACALTSASCNNSTGGPINWSSTSSLYLTMKFNGDAAGFMSPTIHITSVPFAFNADQLGGISSSGFVQNSTSLQSSSNFHISGTGVADTQLQSPLHDTATSNGTLGIGTTNAGVITIGNVTNSTVLFNLKNTSTTALQIKNGSGNELFTVDTSNNKVLVGKAGTGGINGAITFNSATASSFGVTIAASGTTAASYTLTLPTALPGSTQCITSTTAGVLGFSACSGGGGGTLAADYASGSSSADQTILLTAADGNGILIQDAASTVGTLFAVQSNAGTATYLGITSSLITLQDSSAHNSILFDLANHAIQVCSTAASYCTTNYASISATGTDATFKSNTGTTKIGNGTGSISITAGSGSAVDILAHASSVWQTDAGSLQIQGGTTLSLLSTSSNAASFDSGTTGAVNLGTGANSKAITIGNNQTGTTVSIEAGTAAGSLALGAGATAHDIDIGTGAAAQTVTIGSTNTTSTTTIQSGSGNITLQVSGTGTTGNVVIGSGNGGAGVTTPDLLILDDNSSSTDPTEVDGAMYYNVATESFRCGRDGFWSDCAINGIDHGYNFEDDFLSGITPATTSAVGELNWIPRVGTCAAPTYNPTATVTLSHDHPGVLQAKSGATSGNICIYGAATNNTVIIAPGDVIKTTAAVEGTLANVIYRTGWTNQGATASTRPTSGVWWEADNTTNARWQYCYNSNGTATCANNTNGTPTIAANTWVRLEIRIISSTAVDFIYNGTKVSLTGITYDSGSTNKLEPTMACGNRTAATQTCDIDYFQWKGVITTSGGR